MREIVIAGRRIADDTEAFVVAEIGSNHQGDIETCKSMFRIAADCGASAVKLQKRDIPTLHHQHPEWWTEPYNSEHAFGPTYGAHREALEFEGEEYQELKVYAERLGLVFFATAWDIPSVDFLARLGMPAIKLASASIVDEPLLRRAMEVWVPLIISTGGATLGEIDAAVDLLAWGTTPFAVLACTSQYPCPASAMNLRIIESFRHRYSAVVGLSDHYPKPNLAIAAYTLGARIFEKHFSLNRAWKGSDQAFSLEPDGLRTLVQHLHETREALGDGVKRRLPEEIPALVKMGRTFDA